MSNEISTQQTSLTGQTLYATLDGLTSPNVGLRWNTSTTAFETVTSADWTNYAITMTEATGTGYFTCNQPSGIPAGTPLSVTIYQRIGGSPATTDPVKGAGMIGGTSYVAPPTNFPLLGITSDGKISEVVLCDTLTTYTNNTPQTGDVYGSGFTSSLSSIITTNINATISSRSTYAGGAVASVTAPVTVNAINGLAPPTNWNDQSIDTSGRVLLQPSQPSVTIPTVTTVGTTTTTTNLTNSPNSGDFTTTMKASLNSATPASVTGAVGSVTGNIGGNLLGNVDGNVMGSVASVTAPGTLANASIDIPTFTSSAWEVIARRLVSTGVTTPVTADHYKVGGFDANGNLYYESSNISPQIFIWNDGAGWTMSETLLVDGSAYWTTGSSSNVLGPYSAQGTATGIPTVTFKGGAMLDALQLGGPVDSNLNFGQVGLTPRALDSIADSALTVGDALVAALCIGAGKQAIDSAGTTYTIETPSTGTVIRTFTLSPASLQQSRS